MDPLAVDEARLFGRRRGARRPPGGGEGAGSMRTRGSARSTRGAATRGQPQALAKVSFNATISASEHPCLSIQKVR
ncbi:MAG: hypothetical protein Q8P41_26800 [Pseudomonadota bacterium]|nr:hypothetical protein [Pseudomonadota bacterium]